MSTWIIVGIVLFMCLLYVVGTATTELRRQLRRTGPQRVSGMGRARPATVTLSPYEEVSRIVNGGWVKPGRKLRETPSFRQYLAFASNPGIHPLAEGIETLRLLHHLGLTVPRELQDLYLDPHQVRRRFGEFLLLHQTDSGGFKHSPNAWPSLFGVVNARDVVRTMCSADKDLALTREHFDSVLGKKKTLRLIEFVQACQTESGFAETPAGQPTVIGTRAAYSVLKDLGAVPPDPDSSVDFLHDSFKQVRLNGAEGPQMFGFGNSPEEDNEVSVMPTHNGVATPRLAIACLREHRMDKTIKKTEDLIDKIRTHKDGVLNFLESCIPESKAGFASAPGEPDPGIVFTRAAISTLTEMNEPGVGLEKPKLFSALSKANVSQYLMEIRGDGYVGFSSGSVPNLLAMSNAVMLIELVIKLNILPESDRSFKHILHQILNALPSFIDPETKIFVVYRSV